MRNLMNLVAAGLLAVLFAAPAAQSLPYEGTLQLAIGTLPPFVVPGNGDGVSTATDVGFGPGANFTTTVTVAITGTMDGMLTFPAFPIVDLALTGPAGLTTANFSAGGAPDGGFGGSAGLAGNAKIGLFGPPPFAFLTVPLSSFGVEGATAMVASPLGVSITAVGGGWSTGTVSVVGDRGPFLGQVLATAMGTDARTVGGGGQIVLVTPTLAITNVGGSENLPLIGTLTLNFVPEPGTLLLLGSGIAGLAMIGRRRKATA